MHPAVAVTAGKARKRWWRGKVSVGRGNGTGSRVDNNTPISRRRQATTIFLIFINVFHRLGLQAATAISAASSPAEQKHFDIHKNRLTSIARLAIF
ncbi:hypothetical protein [Geotalea uraniireducens]|uniref:hypothetical protein n=1 Tax=Geotalea uraniireducens TaxID=351604 RepID=UPI00248FDB77|nr:hypothetical protein [Geotalea uraniireducens]